jgi:putative ATP-dependent endonuclease of OLD family
MPRLKSISIENYRSIGENPVEIEFPKNSPLILIGENNSGKSNIIRAIEIMFGEFHPKFKKLDDYDHFNRNPKNKVIIAAEVSGFRSRLGRSQEFSCTGFYFSCKKNQENEFSAIQDNGELNKYVSNELRDELLCVCVNAEQNLSYQLSYSTKYTLLSKVTKAFHDKLTEDEARVEKLKGFFNQIKETFLEVPDFKSFTDQMSTIAGEMLSNMSHALEFDFSAYDPSNYFKTLRVHPFEDGESRAFEELGTGQQQILALSFAHAYAKSFLGQGLIFIIDEPETHLHPLAQKWLAKKVFHMAKDGLQIIITTHSPYFINLEFLPNIYLVKKNSQTEAINIDSEKLTKFCHDTGATKASKETIIPFYASHSKPHILNGFFAKKIVLVEGETEEFALPTYFESIGLDTLKEGIAIIGVGGKGNLAKWWRLFTCYGIPIYICFDNDAEDDSSGIKRADALKAIGIDVVGIAEILTIDDWNISSKFCVFGKDFENTMTNSFQVYQDVEKEEKHRLGSSNKPIIARAVAERLISSERNEDDIGWRKFGILGKRIKRL